MLAPLIIETERLELRSVTPDDIPHIQALYSNPEVLQYLPPMEPMTMDEAKQRVGRRMKMEAERGFAPLVIGVRLTGELIGSGGLQPVGGQPGPEVEIVYHFLPSAWGFGYATEAATAILEFGFDKLMLNEILAFVMPGNEASSRVLEKSGMRYVGMATYQGVEGQVKKYVADRETWLPPRLKGIIG